MPQTIHTEYLAQSDTRMARLMKDIPLPEYANTYDVFEDLASCILDMRIHYAGSRAAFRYKRLKQHLSPDTPLDPELFLLRGPQIRQVLKLSYQKYDSLLAWSRHWLESDLGSLDWHAMSAEDVSELLLPVKGIGKWSVQMILLFTLEHPDIFPMGDYQLRKAMCSWYGLEEDGNLDLQLNKISEAWAPERSLATRYLLRWRETTGGAIIESI